MPDTDTPTAQCGVCTAPTADGIYLCKTHLEQLAGELRRVPDLADELDVTITRRDKLSPHADRKSTAESPLAWNEHAAQAAWELNATVNAWSLDASRIDEDDRDPLARIHHSETAELARWLRGNLSALKRHEEAGQAHDELSNAIHRAHRAVDYPNTRSRFEVGPCPQDINGEPCDGKVWAFIASSDDKVSFMRCVDCETKWDSTQWLRVGPRIYRRKQQLKWVS